MKWITHQTGAVLGAVALALPLPGVVCASFGAVLPDVIDQRLSMLAPGSSRKAFNRLHRGSSHWFGWWLLLFLAILAFPLPVLCRDAAAGFTFGGLTHIGMDSLTPRGVPVLPYSRRLKLALPVCSTGSLGEYIFLAAIIAAGLFLLRDNLQTLLAGLGLRF